MGRSRAGPRSAVAAFAVTVMLSMAVSVYHLVTHQAPLLPTILGQWSLLVLSVAFGGGGYYALTSVEKGTERAIIGWRANVAFVLGGVVSGGYAYHIHLTPEAEFGLDSVVFQATFVAIAAGIAGLVIGHQTVSRIQARDDLEATVVEFERTIERLDEFASVVSHDLRNPLNVIEGRVELAREESENEHLAAIARAADRMHELIDDLLTLAREGHKVGEMEPVDMESIAAACWKNVETNSATLNVETGRMILANRSQIQQLLENLFRNAVEHAGPEVTISVGVLGSGNGFYVADDGPGIAPENREKVFEPGYTRADDGIGFGLSIVRQIAEGNGWEINLAESAEGGARFEFHDNQMRID